MNDQFHLDMDCSRDSLGRVARGISPNNTNGETCQEQACVTRGSVAAHI